MNQRDLQEAIEKLSWKPNEQYRRLANSVKSARDSSPVALNASSDPSNEEEWKIRALNRLYEPVKYGKEARLLRIHVAQGNATKLEASFEIFPLNDLPPFTIVESRSADQAKNNEARTCGIVVNKVPIQVNVSLKEDLLRIWHGFPTLKYLWTAALCIGPRDWKGANPANDLEHPSQPNTAFRKANNSSSKPYQYDSIKPGIDEIRLFRIKPAVPGSVSILEIEIFSVALKNKPAYTALSYTQEIVPATFGISTGQDTCLSVTPSLGKSLILLRDHGFLVVWSDQVCINQDDDIEKIHQIAIMSQIYQQAETVVANVGSTPRFVREPLLPEPWRMLMLALSQLRSRLISERKPDQIRWEELPEYGLPAYVGSSHSVWDEWRDVRALPYFSEISIAQELCVSGKVMLICNGIMSRFSDMLVANDFLRSEEFTGEEITSGAGGGRMMLTAIASLTKNLGKMELFDLVRKFRYIKAANPVDKIYAFVGLSKNEPLMLAGTIFCDGCGDQISNVRHVCTICDDFDYCMTCFSKVESIHPAHIFRNLSTSRIQELPQLEYGKPVSSVYHEFASHFVLQGHGTELLCDAVRNPGRSYPDMPSWVPDWNDDRSYGQVDRGPSTPSHHVRLTRDPSIIVAHGYVFDTLKGAVTDGPGTAFTKFTPELMSKALTLVLEDFRATVLSCQMLLDEDGVKRRYGTTARTALAKLLSHDSGNPHILESHEYLLDQLLLAISHAQDDLRAGRGFHLGVHLIALGHELAEEIGFLFAAATVRLEGHKVMITERGYLSLVPTAAQGGDEIIGMIGCGGSSFTMRRERGQNHRVLIGDAHLQIPDIVTGRQKSHSITSEEAVIERLEAFSVAGEEEEQEQEQEARLIRIGDHPAIKWRNDLFMIEEVFIG